MKDHDLKTSTKIEELFQKNDGLHTQLSQLGALDFNKMLSGVSLISGSSKKTPRDKVNEKVFKGGRAVSNGN